MSNMQAPVVSYLDACDPWSIRLAGEVLERAFGRARIQAVYDQVMSEAVPSRERFARALSVADIMVDCDEIQEKKIPRDGPLVILANHPFGIVDGMILCALAARTGRRFKILLHARLCREPSLTEFFLPVSFDGTKAASRENVATKREALSFLSEGGTLLIFPGGGVSTRSHLGLGALEEFPWSTFVAKLVRLTEATVVPVFFHGENGRLFHFSSAFSQTMRLSLLFREVTRRFGTTVKVSIGDPVPFRQIEHIGHRAELTAHLKEMTFRLADGVPTTPRIAAQ